MSETREALRKFQDELAELVNKYTDSGITYCEYIGTLELMKLTIADLAFAEEANVEVADAENPDGTTPGA